MKSLFYKDYARDEDIKKSEQYKYNGHSRSLIYKHAFGPLAQYCVNRLPTTLAPNTITVIAFLFSLLPHLLILAYAGDDLSAEIPGWVAVLCGIGQFLYMHFDNMDGKQARRIQASSPLGMMFDHGLDSVTTWVIALSFMHVMRIGNSILNLLVLFITGIITFYLAFWEQNYTGVLELGVLSPVDEGTTFVNLIMISTCFLGSTFYLKESFIPQLQWNHLLIVQGIIMAIYLWGNSIRNVYRCTKGKFWEAHKKLGSVYALIVTVAILIVFSPSQIAVRRIPSIVYCFGLAYSKVIGHFQLAHVTETEFMQWRKSLIFTLTAIIINTIVANKIGTGIIDEDLLLNFLIGFNLVCYLHYMYNLSRQYSQVLKIKVFGVPDYKDNSNKVQ